MISDDVAHLFATLRDMMIVLTCCSAIIFMLKRKNNAPQIPREASSDAQRFEYFDAFSPFKCSHFGCNRAPPPSKYRYDADKKKWKQKHERAFSKMHDACLNAECSCCIEVFRMNMKKYRQYRVLHPSIASSME